MLPRRIAPNGVDAEFIYSFARDLVLVWNFIRFTHAEHAAHTRDLWPFSFHFAADKDLILIGRTRLSKPQHS
jgi:hypothetical protein